MKKTVATNSTTNTSTAHGADASDVSESDLSATEGTGTGTHRTKRTTPHPSVVYKTAPYQFVTEMLTVGCIISTAYIILEGVYGAEARLSAANLEILVRVAVSCAAGATLMFYFVRQHIHLTLSAQSTEHTVDKHRPVKPLSLKKFFFSVVGWAWVVTSIMILLPLFSLPVLHAVEPLYSRSFVIGSIVRTFEKVVLPEVLKVVWYIYG